MAHKYKILLSVAPIVLLLDQLTKIWVLHALPLGARETVIPRFFDLVHFRNTGAAFGLFATLPEPIRAPFFYGISILALFILGYSFYHLTGPHRWYAWPLSLITSGVVGNSIDRLRFGNVVDFISVHINDVEWFGIYLEWPAFNVADSAITVSVIWIAIQILRGK